ncbi:MAG TPA: hypothetical protein VKT81_03890, partial [Bryobacteraceae bacterium]|nr:hypothetical protein [Bryobacteraceae bacterium]
MNRLILPAAWIAITATCHSADLTALPEYRRPDPFGAVVSADRAAHISPSHSIALETARAAYVSFHLAVSLPNAGDYRLEINPFPTGSGLHVELYREWLHYLPSTKNYYPDALIPISPSYHSRLPEPDNRIPKQTTQAFWLDIWTAANAKPGEYETTAHLHADGKTIQLPIQLKVL